MNELTTFEQYQTVDGEDAALLIELGGWFEKIYSSKNKCEMRREVAAVMGMKPKTLQNRYYKWESVYRATGNVDEANLAMRDRRGESHAVVPMGGDFVYNLFMSYARRDTNTSSNGWETMMRDFRSGVTFVDFGGWSWKDVWRAQRPGEQVPVRCPSRWVPTGWGKGNMYAKAAKDAARDMQLAWSRRGQFAALGNTLPVIRSRQDLPVGALYQADDVWHNIDCFMSEVKGTFNPLEFAIYDMASGYKAVSVIKPRIPVMDPKTGKEVRDNLKEMQFRFAVMYLVCCVGYNREKGMTLIGERGTTAIRENVLRRVENIPGFGKKFHFLTSGTKNTPAHKGLLMGNAGGNPRMKSFCECAHNVMHNATASLLGSHGRDAAHLHESNAAVVRYTEKTLAEVQRVCGALAEDVIDNLALPIVNFKYYPQYFYAMQDWVMDRTDHRLEGWDGYEVQEYRLSTASDEWRDVRELSRMSDAQRSAVMAVLNLDAANLMRMRRMSRRERWTAGQNGLERLPLEAATAFLDPRDAREATVRADGTIEFTDAMYYGAKKMRYVAQYRELKTGVVRRLAPGTKVRFFWCPLGELSEQIWLTDEAGEACLGMCRKLYEASWADPHSIKVAMGQQQAQIAELMAETHAEGEMQGVRRIAAEKVNIALIEAAKEAKAAPVTMGGAHASLEELSGEATSSSLQSEDETTTSDPTDFLAQMNLTH